MIDLYRKVYDDANQVFMARFPESGNIQTESLKGVLVVKVLLKENSFKIQFQHFYRRAQNATGWGWDRTG